MPWDTAFPGWGVVVPGIFCHPSPKTKPPWGFARVFSPSFHPARFCGTSGTTVGHPRTVLIQITCRGDRCLPLGELLGPAVPPLPWGTPGRSPGRTDGTAWDGATLSSSFGVSAHTRGGKGKPGRGGWAALASRPRYDPRARLSPDWHFTAGWSQDSRNLAHL